MGRYQRATMWGVGALLTAGFVGDAIDFLVFENPPEVDVARELGWTLVFLLTVAAVEGVLWLAFRSYNSRKARA